MGRQEQSRSLLAFEDEAGHCTGRLGGHRCWWCCARPFCYERRRASVSVRSWTLDRRHISSASRPLDHNPAAGCCGALLPVNQRSLRHGRAGRRGDRRDLPIHHREADPAKRRSPNVRACGTGSLPASGGPRLHYLPARPGWYMEHRRHQRLRLRHHHPRPQNARPRLPWPHSRSARSTAFSLSGSQWRTSSKTRQSQPHGGADQSACTPAASTVSATTGSSPTDGTQTTQTSPHKPNSTSQTASNRWSTHVNKFAARFEPSTSSRTATPSISYETRSMTTSTPSTTRCSTPRDHSPDLPVTFNNGCISLNSPSTGDRFSAKNKSDAATGITAAESPACRARRRRATTRTSKTGHQVHRVRHTDRGVPGAWPLYILGATSGQLLGIDRSRPEQRHPKVGAARPMRQIARSGVIARARVRAEPVGS